MADETPGTVDLRAEADAVLHDEMGWQSIQDDARPRDDAYFLEQTEYALTKLMRRGWTPPLAGATPSSAAGPYELERETYDRPLSRAVARLHEGNLVRSGDTDNRVRNTVLGYLLKACHDNGVTLGALDGRILEWMAGGERHVCEVVIGLIERAHEAGKSQ